MTYSLRWCAENLWSEGIIWPNIPWLFGRVSWSQARYSHRPIIKSSYWSRKWCKLLKRFWVRLFTLYRKSAYQEGRWYARSSKDSYWWILWEYTSSACRMGKWRKKSLSYRCKRYTERSVLAHTSHSECLFISEQWHINLPKMDFSIKSRSYLYFSQFSYARNRWNWRQAIYRKSWRQDRCRPPTSWYWW